MSSASTMVKGRTAPEARAARVPLRLRDGNGMCEAKQQLRDVEPWMTVVEHQRCEVSLDADCVVTAADSTPLKLTTIPSSHASTRTFDGMQRVLELLPSVQVAILLSADELVLQEVAVYLGLRFADGVRRLLKCEAFGVSELKAPWSDAALSYMKARRVVPQQLMPPDGSSWLSYVLSHVLGADEQEAVTVRVPLHDSLVSWVAQTMGVVESRARCCSEVAVTPSKRLTLSFVQCNLEAVKVGLQLGHRDCVAAMMDLSPPLRVVDLLCLDELQTPHGVAVEHVWLPGVAQVTRSRPTLMKPISFSHMTTLDLSACRCVETLDSDFGSESSLVSVRLGAGLRTLEDNLFFSSSRLEVIDMSQCTELTSVGRSFARNCDALRSITFPPSLMTLGGGCFFKCPRLSTIDLSGCTQLERINNSFASFSGVSCVMLPPSITSIGNTFCPSCVRIEAIDLSRCTSLTEVGMNFARGCASLRRVALPWSSIRRIADDFCLGCKRLDPVRPSRDDTTVPGSDER